MSKLPIASNANLWMKCAASVQAPKIPTVDGEISEARKEGLGFHELSEIILSTWSNPAESQSFDRKELIGKLSKHGIPFDDDMYDMARDYSNDILKVYNQASPKTRELRVEGKIDTGVIYPDTYGYVDAMVIDPATRTVTIWDAKYGHTLVEVEENYQLLAYAISILMTELGNKVETKGWTFSLRVYQPRGFHRDGVLREWTVEADDLTPYYNDMFMQAQRAMHDKPLTLTGSHCYKANCRHACESFQRVSYKAMDVIETYAHSDLTGAALATEIITLRTVHDAVKARLMGLEEQAVANVRNGEAVPGLIVEQGYGRERWRKDIDQQEVIDMGDLMDVDLRKPRELMTPTQCGKKGVDRSVIDAYSEKPKTGWKLKIATEDRIRKMFNNRS